jgi:hypothetical protein
VDGNAKGEVRIVLNGETSETDIEAYKVAAWNMSWSRGMRQKIEEGNV